ncbi:serine/threonine-protein kinase [Myxococcus dinghuensis]|uniref:serine/threonine-protein kinase n=1 Tax=Myxococcus dinghuensis TaxID=2906761 RepID=UPI0038996404
MAETWRAQLKGAAGVTKPVLIKKVLPEYANDEAFTSMFISEARISATLSHGSIAQVFDFGEVDGEYFLAMEFVDGQPLHRVMKRVLRSGFTSLPVPIATYIALEMCRGLHYAHTRVDESGQPLGIVHRDISPDNVLLSYEGQVKIVDFGIAKARSLRSFDTAPGVVKGKYLFFSPEQARGEEVDARTDVWAAAVVLFEMVCGRLPLEGPEYVVMHKLHSRAPMPRARDLKPDLPTKLDAILQKALAVDKKDRFESAHAFGDALAGFLFKAAPRFSSMSVAHLLNELFREDLRALGKETKVPNSFVEELSVWRATANLPKPTDIEVPQLSEEPRTRKEETARSAEAEAAELEEEEGGGNSPDRGSFLERGGLRVSSHHLVVVGALVVVGGLLWSSFSKLKPDWVPPEQEAKDRARNLPPKAVPGEPPGSTARKVEASSPGTPKSSAALPGISTPVELPVEFVQLEARRDVFRVSSGYSAQVRLDAQASYRIQETTVLHAAERAKPFPQLFYLFTGDFSADVALGVVTRNRSESFQGASTVFFFTVGAPSTHENLPQRGVTLTNMVTNKSQLVPVHPEQMATDVDRALLIKGMDASETYFLSVEPVGDGAFTRGRARGPVNTVACVQEVPVNRDGISVRPGTAQRFLVSRGQGPVKVTNIQALRCGFVDDEVSDNEGAVRLRIESARALAERSLAAGKSSTPQAEEGARTPSRKTPPPEPVPEAPPKPAQPGDDKYAEARSAYAAGKYSLARSRARECLAVASEHDECLLVAGDASAKLNLVKEAAFYYGLFLQTAPKGHPEGSRVLRMLEKYEADLQSGGGEAPEHSGGSPP